jgi:hypothetical protein
MEYTRGNYNNKIWEELTAYLPFIWNGPHMKLYLQQFFNAAGISFPGCYLPIIAGCTDKKLTL